MTRWLAAAGVIATLNSVNAVVFGILAVLEHPGSGPWYTLARSAVLLVAIIVVFALRNVIGVVVVGAILALVQAADAIIGATEGDPVKVVLPAVLAVLTAIGVWVLWRHRPAVG
jgi:hypothetical protein